MITIFCLASYWAYQHLESYKIRGKVIDKTMTQNRDGNYIRYYVMVELDNGEIEEHEVEINSYYNSNVGDVWSFTRHRFK